MAESDVSDWVEEDGEPESLDLRALKREVVRLRRERDSLRGGTGLIIDAVKQALETPPDLVLGPRPKKSRKAQQEIAVLHVSDTQIGKVTSTYDSSVADRRLQQLAEKAIQIVETRRSNSAINELRVYLGGDMVEGEDIFPGQAHHIDQDVFCQAVKDGPEMLTRMIIRLLDEFPKVKVCCVVGNHGRPGRKGGSYGAHTNWDRVCYEVIQLMLLGPHAPRSLRERLEVVVADSWYYVDRVYQWGNLLLHGDQIRGQNGFPWYGTNKKMAGWYDSIEEPWDNCYFGHFHTYTSGTVNSRRFLCNGTTESHNTFAQEQMAASGHPVQRLNFFNEKYGLISDHPVWLVDDGDRLPQKMRAERWMAAQ